MKYGPYKVLDCSRKTRAIANANGKIVYLSQEGAWDPTDQKLYAKRHKEEKVKKDAGRTD